MTRCSPLGCLAALLLGACAKAPEPTTGAGETPAPPLGIEVDGSSTVYLITKAVAEEFRQVRPEVSVTVRISGTGGGFKRFTAGATDINDASRPISRAECKAAEAGSISFIELPVAFDGLSVLVNPANAFVERLTVAELKRLWEPESKVTTWHDLRQGWPKRDIHLYGPGRASGTFDYFTTAVAGREGAARADYTGSEDDNVLVEGIAADADALGFFGFAYYVENQDKLKLVPIDDGHGKAVAPSERTIKDGSYRPLSRPLFIYVKRAAAERSEVAAFVDYFLTHAATVVEQVGYVALPAETYELARARFAARTPGSVFGGGSQVGVSIGDIVAREK